MGERHFRYPLFTSILPPFYLNFTSFLPLFNLNLTSASSRLSNHGLETAVYIPLDFGRDGKDYVVTSYVRDGPGTRQLSTCLEDQNLLKLRSLDSSIPFPKR